MLRRTVGQEDGLLHVQDTFLEAHLALVHTVLVAADNAAVYS